MCGLAQFDGESEVCSIIDRYEVFADHARLGSPPFGAMNPEELRGHCLSFPGAEETFPFGPENSVFKVAGKIFALSRLAGNPLRVSLKCEPPLAGQLREAHAAVVPGYLLNNRHWNTVIIDRSLPDETINDMVEDSYDLVVSKLPRARRRALGWRSDA
jgi:predicted DNA-binding protein (MmcQ/YjbR family)